MGDSYDHEPEPTVPFINLEPKEEEEVEDMAPKLKVDFKERYRKHLNKALPLASSPAKKVYPEASCQEPALNAIVLQVPHNDVIESRQELAVILSVEDTCLDKNGVSTATPSGNAKEKDDLAISSSWEEIAALLKAVPCFITPEPPAFGVEEFFPFSHRHFINLDGDPRMAGVIRPSHVTPDSAFRCTYPLLKYTTEKTTEVVRFISLMPNFAVSFSSDTWFDSVSGGGVATKLTPQMVGCRGEHEGISDLIDR